MLLNHETQLPDNVVHVGQERMLISSSTVISCNGEAPLPNAAVLIENRRIVRVGPTESFAPNEYERRHDFAGAAVMPGLIDAHVHLTGNRTWDEYRQFMGPELDLYPIRAAADAAELLHAGFTTVRDLGVPGPAVEVRAAIRAGLSEGPRIVASIAAISQNNGHADARVFPYALVNRISPFAIEGAPKGMMVDGIDACLRAVRLVQGQGADVIKLFLHHSLWEDTAETESPLEFSDAELRTLIDEAHRLGFVVSAHAESVNSTMRAAAFGAETIEHGMRLPDAEVLNVMAEQHSILVPTLALTKLVEERGEEMGFSVEECVAAGTQVRERQLVVAAARSLGIEVAAGSSLGNITGTKQGALEIELLAAAGLTPLEALEAATRVSAKACGRDYDLGTIEAGKLADLVVIAGNPAVDIAQIANPPVAVFATSRTES